MAEEAEEVVDAEVIPSEGEEATEVQGPVRSLSERASSAELSPWRGEVRTAVVAAAGGLAAGAATVAAVSAVRERAARKSPGRGRLGRKRQDDGILASRSFMVDIHLLGR